MDLFHAAETIGIFAPVEMKCARQCRPHHKAVSSIAVPLPDGIGWISVRRRVAHGRNSSPATTTIRMPHRDRAGALMALARPSVRRRRIFADDNLRAPIARVRHGQLGMKRKSRASN